MPNQLDATGLQTATQAELQTFYTEAFQAIYGTNINLKSPTPDGQLLQILVQANLDIEDLLAQIYASFDPNQAVGVQLDQRCAINGIERQAGTFTIQNVSLVASQALTLYGLDQTGQTPFTVADNSGNQYQLQVTQNIATPGTYSYSFQCTVDGPIQSSPNTVTNQITVVVGITSVNNPTVYTSLGLTEETDQTLRLRRQKSVQQPSQGYFNALYAALSNVPKVTSVWLYENNGAATDSNGVPGHSIWAILNGGTDEDIAHAIYYKRNEGCGMKGSQSCTITQKNGSLFTVLFDRVNQEGLYTQFTVTPLDPSTPVNLAAIIAQLPTLFVPGVGREVNANALATAIQQIDSNAFVSNAGFSAGGFGPFTPTKSPSGLNYQFKLYPQTIYALPILIVPGSPNILHGTTQQFIAAGGTQTSYAWSLISSGSGGSITTGGLYTAGSTFPSTDVVQVQDSNGNASTSTVSVS